jgi:hypothetical protein
MSCEKGQTDKSNNVEVLRLAVGTNDTEFAKAERK